MLELVGLVLWVPCLLFALIAFSRGSSLAWKVKELRERVAKLESASAGVGQVSPVKAPEAAAPIIKAEDQVEVPVTKASVPELAKIEADAPQPLKAHTEAAASGKTKNFESQLASRWFVWIGAAAVALGGLLFVRYAAQHQLAPPIVRVALGLLLGGVLVAVGEYLRRTKTAADTYIPAGLSSGGIVTAFGSIYAAHAFYDLMGPTAAFIGLGIVALSALALSSRQGPLLAAVGLIGSYLTPALVVSQNPQALGLFIYLLVIVAACLAVVRTQGWNWLGYLALFGAAGWAMLWVEGGTFHVGDATVVSLFCFAMAGMAAFSISGKSVFAADAGNLLAPQTMSSALRFALAGGGLAMLVLSAQVLESHHDNIAMLFFGAGVAGVAGFGWLREGNSFAAALAAVLTFGVIFSWRDEGYNDLAGEWPRLATWSIAAMVGFGVFGAAGYLRKTPDVFWAALAAVTPAAFLFALYHLVPTCWPETSWALVATALALVQISLAWIKRQDELSPALLMAVSAMLAVFALDRFTTDIWLTLWVAGLAVVYALASRVFATRHIGLISGLLATLAELRLFLRHSGFEGYAPLPLGLHWPLYGYGLPAAGFWWASRILADDKYRRYRIAFEGLSLGLLITLMSLEIRAFVGGDEAHFSLLELGAHICAWLGAGYGLAYRQTLFSSRVSTWGARILLSASAVALGAGALLWFNPLFNHEPLDGGVIFNSLTLAYLVPCILLGLFAQKLLALGIGRARTVVGALALACLLAYVTFELKFLFEGRVLDGEFASDAESYAISFCWLALAIAFFIAGLKWQRISLRYGGVAVMALALLKTFGYDLWKLGGLWQIASVMGIGLSLVGVGWLYARFMRGGDTVKPSVGS